MLCGADAKAGAAAGKKKAAGGKGKAAEAGKEVAISRKKRAVAMKKQDKGKESGGDLAPARQPLPPGDRCACCHQRMSLGDV